MFLWKLTAKLGKSVICRTRSEGLCQWKHLFHKFVSSLLQKFNGFSTRWKVTPARILLQFKLLTFLLGKCAVIGPFLSKNIYIPDCKISLASSVPFFTGRLSRHKRCFCVSALLQGLQITASQRTMSGQKKALSGQILGWPDILSALQVYHGKNSPISRDKSQICWSDMCLVKFLPNFADLPEFRSSATTQNYFWPCWP